MGQHNTQLHRISSIPDAFNARYDIIVNAIKNTLIPKRTQLIAQITRVDYRLEEIKTVKGIIYRDIKNEYGGVVERLNSAEGVKLAILQYDIAELQKDVNKIDGILQHLDELNGVGGAPQPAQATSPAPTPAGATASLVQPVGQSVNQVGFLLNFKRLQEDIDELITKQFKTDIPVIPNDLPRELAEKRVKLEEYEKQKVLLKEKNDVILKLVQEMKLRENTIKDELDKQTKAHVAQSLDLLDDYATELKKFQLICTF
jgi:palmitoyltransferase